MRLQCGPRCKPLGGAEARGSESACADSDGPKGAEVCDAAACKAHSNPVDIDESSHQDLVELARCRSDLSQHLLA